MDIENTNLIFKIFVVLMLFVLYMFLYDKLFLRDVNLASGMKVDIVLDNSIKIDSNYVKCITKINEERVEVIYYFPEDLTEEEMLEIEKKIKYGQVYEVEIDTVEKIENKYKNSSSFNYSRYMLSKKVKEQVVVKDFKLVSSKNRLKYKIYNFRKDLVNRVKVKYPNNYSYINALVLGEKIDDDDVQDAIVSLGIVQFFVISGLHINFLLELMRKVFKKLDEKQFNIIIVLFLFFYSYLANMGVSIKRVLETKYLSIYFGNKKSRFDIWKYVFIGNLIVNPFNVFNVGFIFSYLMALFLIINKELFFYRIDKEFTKNYLTFMFLLPLSINLNSYLNLLLLVILKYYDKLIKYLMIFSFIAILVMKFNILVLVINGCISFMIFLLKSLCYFNSEFVICIKRIGLIGILLYYYFYFKQVEEIYYYGEIGKKYKKMFLICLVFFCLNLNILGEVHIIDVGQGDSILIQYPFNGKTILIDTGDITAEEEIIDYLKAEGVRKIDYFIISHNHQDHNGNLDEIVEEFNVKNLYISESYYESDIEKFNNFTNAGINVINVDTPIKTPFGYLYVPNNVDSENENNNSLVLYTRLGFSTWLFMGDAESEEEEKLISSYFVDADYIKLPHHGSSTSTTQEFLDATTPKEVYISSGKDNMYNHPSGETLNRLEENSIRYLDTQTDGEIVKYFI